MNVVTFKKKNICIIVLCCFIAFSVYKKLRAIFEADEELEKKSNPFAFAAWMSCTRNIAWFTKRNVENEVASAFYRSIGKNVLANMNVISLSDLLNIRLVCWFFCFGLEAPISSSL